MLRGNHNSPKTIRRFSMGLFVANLEKFVITLAEKGWFVSKDFNLLAVVEVAVKDDDTIESALISTYRNPENMEKILSELKTFFPERAHLIQSAFEAHQQGNYNASIPLLLAQADGIGQDVFGVNYFSKQKGVPRTKDVVGKKLTGHLAGGIIEAVVKPLVSGSALVLNRHEMKNRRTKDPNYGVLNRHEILHGVDKNYGNEPNSLRAISQLSYLAMLKRILTPR
jgi:hypothetical protein